MTAVEPNLALVIPCSRPEKVNELLQSIENSEGRENVEVFVCGKVPTDLPKDWDFFVQFVAVPNPHANVKRNRGIKRSRADHIAFLDDDVTLTCDWIKTALSLISKFPQRVFTGPEVPPRSGRTSSLVYSVCKSFFAEFSSCHINFKRQRVSFADVPFCNCIVPRELISLELNESIPWDIDDFHFFSSLPNGVEFDNVPELLVTHDRYPDSIWMFLAYKWRTRRRTGVNALKYPQIYLRLPGIVLTLLLPYIFFISGILNFEKTAQALLYLGAAYLLTVSILMSFQLKRSILLIGLHLTTFLAVQRGFYFRAK